MPRKRNLVKKLDLEYITIMQVARLLGWERVKTTRWLAKAGALIKRGGRWRTTKAILKQCFPEVYWSIVEPDFDIHDSFYSEMKEK